MTCKKTPERIAFVKANYETSSLEVMASVCGVSMTTMQRWCDELGLKTSYRKVHPITAKAIEVKKLQLPVPKQEGRPPAVYSNTSREEHIERILNMAI